MRRFSLLIALLAALALTASASATLQPINRSFGEHSIPRFRHGTIVVPAGHRAGRVRVIVGLAQPPLAAERGPGLFGSLGATKLDAGNRSSRAYVAQLVEAQQAAARQIRAAIPSARVGRTFQVVLNGITVDVPFSRLGRLNAMPFVAQIYPTLRYRMALNRSPSLIQAPAFRAATATDGTGVKIGVVDDGVDQRNAFFNPAGYAYPPGFPKGQRAYTSAKVIAARSFPGPGSGRRGRLPLDRLSSFHGTHVAGIAAGNAGTSSPGGRDHPPTAGLSGVAPRAWIGNYRVFNIPTGVGNLADTPEIVAAFEQAVRDGMDVINFSGGGPATDPRTDALIRTVANVVKAGVVPVISAGNDRDDFGLGTAGSPGTAPEAITVAATSNNHVFAPALRVQEVGAPATLQQIPFKPTGSVPSSWGTSNRSLVDVTSMTGRNGRPVDTYLCGLGRDPNLGQNPLTRGALAGQVALITRGHCTFSTKGLNALEAGAAGLVIVDNRQGEANPVPLLLPVPSGMISNLDGSNLHAYLAARNGHAAVRIGPGVTEVSTERGSIVTSFSSAGPTAFGHLLKPDLAAPGGEILSSTLANFTGGSPFAAIDGTSMSSPHIAGAAALLRARHRDWTVHQLKSALMSTAGSAWGDTSRTQEASVLLEGAGMANVLAADDPKIFTEPQSLSFGDLRLGGTEVSKQVLLSLRDAGGGAGVWMVELRPQSATTGVTIEVPSLVALGPGGTADLPVTVRGAANAVAGDNVGFLVLRNGAVTRRVPYAVFAIRPGLSSARARTLRRIQQGSTRRGASLTQTYRFPTAPFGQSPDYGVGAPMLEDGAERVFQLRLKKRALNFGVSVMGASVGAQINPYVLGAKDENSVQGYVGTPVNINGLMLDYRLPIGAAGAQFAVPGIYYVAVDSGRDAFTGRRLAGTWRLRFWLNDLKRPTIRVLTRRVAAGRPTIATQVLDRGSGVDPYSLVLSYNQALIGAVAFDRATGVAIYPLPAAAPRVGAGRVRFDFLASDYQETKNANSYGGDVMPNTRVTALRLRVTRRPEITWLTPLARKCTAKRTPLLVLASATTGIRNVRFFDGNRRLRVVRSGVAGLYTMTWRTRSAKRGLHRLRAVVSAGKRTSEAARVVRVCR
ncbi:MAG TPA: S8 family serine peptidase [Gaiellaceae bacterium]|nr:S8 family serine peptidase [Gaiellaceae bacterium]